MKQRVHPWLELADSVDSARGSFCSAPAFGYADCIHGDCWDSLPDDSLLSGDFFVPEPKASDFVFTCLVLPAETPAAE